MLIKLILIFCFCWLLFKFLSNPGSHKMRAWKRIAGIIFVVMAVVTILFPDILSRIATGVGVGRGADLLLYALTIAFVFVTFNIYINSKQDQRKLVSLARRVAILEANQQNRTKTKSSSKKVK